LSNVEVACRKCVSISVVCALLVDLGLLSYCRFIYETEHHNGIAELLEILGR
jgi:hypothetical protein